jgi:molybdenum cofactor guanylyltransferase
MQEGAEEIPGIILAGGLSRRMGGGDKGLLQLGGEPLIAHVLGRLRKQAFPVAINANGDASRFAGFGIPVIPDEREEYAGPLAGVLAGMRWASKASPRAKFIVTSACDTPFFPKDLTRRFCERSQDTYPIIVLAKSADRVHPVFGLWPLALAGDLAKALLSGQRKVLEWAEGQPHAIFDFPLIDLGPKLLDPFFNANTPQEFAEAEALLALNDMQ